MCGYVGRKYRVPETDIHYWKVYADLLRLPGAQYYQRRQVDHLVLWQNGRPQFTRATWWYLLKQENNQFIVNNKLSTFNARNLDSPMWREAIRTRRGVLFGSEIGESQGKKHYLMQAKRVFPLGCIYKEWQHQGNSVFSFALITRPPHPRFSRYHDKSMPLFLPADPDFLDHWLDPSVADSPQIQSVLLDPKLRVDFEVTPVKTFKRGEALSESEFLAADEASEP